MNSNIDSRYQKAVEEFVWLEQTANSTLSTSDEDLKNLVNEIALQIISASQLKPTIDSMFTANFSLFETFCIIVQDLDKKAGKDRLAAIENASHEEKRILTQTVKELTMKFEQVSNKDLKAAALLFGIHRVKELVTMKIISIPTTSSEIEQIEKTLEDLRTMRNRYSPEIINKGGPAVQNFIKGVDQAIKENSESLQKLREEEEQKRLSMVN